ncbi:reverse transcriptase domain-containing protein [Tanacetum coccineum]
MSASTTSNSKLLMLDQLELGVTGTIVVMICRMWDVNSAIGRYLSTDFIVFDEKGNLMHCIARGNIAHNFLRLKEGAIYPVKNFTVQPNKDDLCVLRFAHFIIEMDGDTIVRRGQSVRVTLWGGLGEMLIEKHTHHIGLYPVVLTALSVNLYNSKPYLVYQFPVIPALKQFKSDDSGIELAKELLPVDSTGVKALTLICHPWFQAVTFHCAVRVDNIRTKRGWNYLSCGGEKCRKGNLDRKHGRFWCDSCHNFVDYPVLRYRLELEVSDDTAQTVVVMFDETARAVVKCSAGSIDEEETGLPPALANILGTLHTLELKSNSYFEHANYKSFTCWRVVLEEALDESGSSGTLAGISAPKAGVLVPLATTPSVSTPSKPGEPKKARSKTKGSDAGCSSATGKRRRLVLDSSE